MGKLTFEKILAAYLALSALMALALPYNLAIEDFFPIPASAVPLARWLSMVQEPLPFLSTYFFILTAMIPLVVAGFAIYPQKRQQFLYSIPSLGQCLGATAVAVITVAGLFHFAFLDTPPSSTGYRGSALAYAAATSRFGLAIFGALVMGTYALVAYIATVKVPRMWIGYRRDHFG